MKKALIWIVFCLCPLSLRAFDFGGGGGGNGGLDPTTNATTSIDYAHHEIHEGDHYNVTGSSTLAANAIVEFIVKTPNTTKWAHMTFDYQSTASVFTFVGYQNVTVSTTPSVVVTPSNNNGNYANSSGLQIWRSTGTGTTGDYLVGPFVIGVSGNAQGRVGGGSTHATEHVLKQNTWHVFRFTNGADAQTINFRINWYEHANR